ncbi:MAG: 4Fe-4S dicluster domain-containing protein [Pseudomonadota bacterium]
MKGKITIDAELCKGCELCIAACPKGLIRKAKSLNSASYVPAEFTGNEDECEGCALCAVTCPEIAIEVYRG